QREQEPRVGRGHGGQAEGRRRDLEQLRDKRQGGPEREPYDHAGIAVVASTGDAGYQDASLPASFTTVVAVGGTNMVKDGSPRGFTETAWSGAGSGCSDRNKAPSYQDTTATKCKGDAMADVSATGG